MDPEGYKKEPVPEFPYQAECDQRSGEFADLGDGRVLHIGIYHDEHTEVPMCNTDQKTLGGWHKCSQQGVGFGVWVKKSYQYPDRGGK